METYSLTALVFAAVILLVVLMLVRRRHQQQQLAQTDSQPDDHSFEQIELIRVQNPTDQDLQAYALIETERQAIWKSLSTNTSIAPRKIYQIAFDLVQRIAVIYHPDHENPVFQASIADLLELNYRIITRLQDYLEEFPLNTIKDLNVEDILRYKNYYDRFTNFELVKMAQKHQNLYTLGRYLWMGYNALNPWYWGQKVVLTAGKESIFRYLLSVIITIVGEESVLVYSKRNIRAKSAAIEKNIAFEMINMAISDGTVSQQEYEVILDFILNNSRLDEHIKLTLMKALQRKRPTKPTIPLDTYDEKDKKRLLAEVERVAKADTFGLLKKQDALKTIETSLALPSEYRAKLATTPLQEIQSSDLIQEQRRREDAILRLMVQAAAIGGALSDPLRDYILQRAESYPDPFTDLEQQAILAEAVTPTAQDTLTDYIRVKADKERALADILDVLLWYLPFSREKEEFYVRIISALHIKKEGETILLKRLEHRLPRSKLIEKPPAELLKYLYRLLHPEELITALQSTATKYRFITSGVSSKTKDAPCWVCVTTQRVLVLAALTIDRSIYQHHSEFQADLAVQQIAGRWYDAYILHDQAHQVRLETSRIRSAALKQALQAYVQTSDVPKLEGSHP